MVLLRPGSQATVVPQRPAETVKPRKKEKKKHHSRRKRTKTLQIKTAPLGAIKCIKRLKTNKSSANRRSCLEAGYSLRLAFNGLCNRNCLFCLAHRTGSTQVTAIAFSQLLTIFLK